MPRATHQEPDPYDYARVERGTQVTLVVAATVAAATLLTVGRLLL